MLSAVYTPSAPSFGGEVKGMSGFGHAQILGYSEDVESAVVSEGKTLKAYGADGAVIASSIRTLREQTVALNAQQEELKKQLRETTRLYMATCKRLYIVSSGAHDTLIAAVGKDSPPAKILQRLRSRVRRPAGASSPAVP